MSSLVIYRSSGSSESISSSGGESSDDGGSGSDDVDVTRVVNMEAITDPSGNANQDSGRKEKTNAAGSPRSSAATATGSGSSAKDLPSPPKPSSPRVGVQQRLFDWMRNPPCCLDPAVLRFRGAGVFYPSLVHGREALKFLQRPYYCVGPSQIQQGERIRAFVVGFRKYFPAACCVIWCVTQRSPRSRFGVQVLGGTY